MNDDALAATALAAADTLAARGDHDAAFAVLFEAALQQPANAELWLRAGALRLWKGYGDDAARLIQRATALAPASLPAWEAFCRALGMLPMLPNDLVFLSDIAHALTLAEIDSIGALGIATDVVLSRFPPDLELSPEDFVRLRATPLERVICLMLVNILIHARVRTIPLERFLTKTRARHLKAVTQGLSERAADPAVEFLSALAIQCFHNEYLFEETGDETRDVAGLRDDVLSELNRGRVPVAKVAALAAYRPLLDLGEAAHRLPEMAPYARDFTRLLDVQITQPLAERTLRDAIPKLKIEDETSRRVQAQYEENPYPRWTKPQVSQAELEELAKKPALPERVLIAGAGTGRHPLRYARLSPQAEIVALDLSLTSLAYGARQARALGIRNVTFVQGDLLRIADLGMIFDRISAVGVLHHMAEPARGLAALKSVLRPGGTIELALYTVSGRPSVVAGIALREQMGLKPTPEDIRRFRRAVKELPGDHPAAQMLRFPDFYTTSEVRDLVFHVQEHRVTLPEVKAMLAANGLRLERFDVGAEVMAQFRAMFPDARAETDLDAWTQLEAVAPGIFGPMYRFVAADLSPH